jgi:hypothetical protein
MAALIVARSAHLHHTIVAGLFALFPERESSTMGVRAQTIGGHNAPSRLGSGFVVSGRDRQGRRLSIQMSGSRLPQSKS